MERKVITNREFLNLKCYREDLPQINRMFLHDLNKFGPGIDAPLWEKDKFWEKWLDRPFNPDEWARASHPKDQTDSVPKDFYGFRRTPHRVKQLA